VEEQERAMALMGVLKVLETPGVPRETGA
jgi:hypothetical protein